MIQMNLLIKLKQTHRPREMNCGGGKDGGRKLSVGVRQGPGGQSIRPPKLHLGLERTDLASVTDAS